ncbi:hypothetical protein PSACC_03537 [Paramicrosporidium saccamoebae]|uniref:Uncharacterized protein n=1 Tax=Paramicrosporidium saccamoebae TaxID=1246581 RepID=A0A2H9TGB5_9FUNG|nr:hypothetical protein PSACC_03537 [Paramicrosporidium saccamoebae]
MRLSAAVLIITAALLQNTSASAVTAQTYSHNGPAAKAAVSKDGITDFADDSVINTGSPPFDKPASLPPLVFRAMTANNIITFAKYGAKHAGVKLDPKTDLNNANYKKFLAGIGSEQIQACTNDHCLRWLYKGAFELKLGGSLKGRDALNGVQVRTIVDSAFKGDCLKATNQTQTVEAACVKGQLDAIPEKVRKAYAAQIITTAGDNLHYLSADMLKSVFSVASACEKIRNAGSLKAILTSNSLAGAVTAECFAHIPPAVINAIQGDSTDGGVTQAKVNVASKIGLYKLYNGALPKPMLEGISAALMKDFATGFASGDRPGKGLVLENITTNNLSSINQKTLLGNLNANDAVKLASTGKKLTLAHFDKISAEDAYTALRHFDPTAFGNLGGDIIAHIMNDYPAVCSLLPETIEYKNVKLTNSDCFRYLDPKSQAKVLATAASVPDNALVHVTSDMVKGWEYTGARSESFSGANVLGANPKRPNIESIIAGLGVDPDGPNPCKDQIPSVTDMAVVLGDNITYACFKEGEHEIPTDKDAKFSERLRYMVPFPQLLKAQGIKFFENLSEKTFATLMKTGTFCRGVDIDTWSVIKPEIKKNTSSRCLAELMTHLSPTAEDLKGMSESVLAGLQPSQIPASMIPSFSKEQLMAADPSIATIFTADTLKAIDVTALNGEFWANVSPAAFGGVATVQDIKPENMTKWTEAQVTKASEEAFTPLTKEQAQTVGSEAAADASPVKALVAMKGISEEARQVLKSRLKAEDAASEGIPTWVLFIIGGVIAVALIGGLVYFFVLRK